ncbi:MAG: hypothetical protein A3J83_00705 [Elusimicrobia bacterium RIFOXYA2_FULL_40_6]|nr:MAG: hypothetical protein A3J83_00705 [Elusimicrobia bacterium RIFOXYA2_FULL_40_6]
MPNSDKILTTYEISKLCKVDLSTVIDWVNQGKIKAYRTPGGHRRVKLEDFYAFLKEYNLPVPSELNTVAKILIVDDEPQIVKIVSSAIKKISPEIRVESASDGFDAGKKIAEFVPGLVVLDLNIPGIDGFEVCKRIRGDQKLKNTKVLAITGYDTEEYRKNIFSCGADDYLSKPFNIDNLTNMIKKLITA